MSFCLRRMPAARRNSRESTTRFEASSLTIVFMHQAAMAWLQVARSCGPFATRSNSSCANRRKMLPSWLKVKTTRAIYACGILLLGSVAKAPAQSTWNYFISDAGAGQSLVTWSVTGSLAAPPGSVLVSPVSALVVSIDAPGIFKEPYAASGSLQRIPTLDGSYFQLDNSLVWAPIVSYEVNNVPGGGNDSFGLATPTLPPHEGDPGRVFLYHAGTQSVLLPIDYSNFNPGTYQSQESGFNTPVTVNLTVGPVPEPSPLAFSAVSGLCGALAFRHRKKST